jgi:hypothetical protein
MTEGLEQAGYPNIPGEYGIDFSKVKFGNFELTTASGATLIGESQDGYLSLRDGVHEMTAEVKGYGTLEFRLFTKGLIDDPEKGKIRAGDKHPDMYASYFLEVALRNFEKQGVEINEVRDMWYAGTDTYEKYQRVLAETGNRVDAAKSNMFKPLIDRGFTHITEDDIREIVYPNSPNANNVVAVFRREQVAPEKAIAA